MKLTLKNLEFQGKDKGTYFRGVAYQGKGWMVWNFKDFSRNFKESLKSLSMFLKEEEIQNIYKDIVIMSKKNPFLLEGISWQTEPKFWISICNHLFWILYFLYFKKSWKKPDLEEARTSTLWLECSDSTREITNACWMRWQSLKFY